MTFFFVMSPLKVAISLCIVIGKEKKRLDQLASKSKLLEPPILCGRREVIDACYQRFGKPALSKLKQLVSREDIAAELLQEVFIKLWQKEIIFEDEKMLYGWI